MTDVTPHLGDRVVVRYRLGSAAPADWRTAPNPAVAHGPSLSDVTGVLTDDGDPLVLLRDGEQVTVPRAAVTSMRVLPATAVRTSEIRTLEHAAALAWAGTESEWVDGWLARAGATDGRRFTHRANSAVPLERGARADVDTLVALRSWYAERELPLLLALPDRLIGPGQVSGTVANEFQVLTREVGAVSAPDAAVALDAAPDGRWARCYLADSVDPKQVDEPYLALAQRVLRAVNGPVVHAHADVDGELAAIGRGAVTDAPDGTRWLGITALRTAPDHRRRGWGDTMLDTLVAWGAGQGAARVYLQVESGNRLAGTWYRSRGFGLHHAVRHLIPDLPI